MPQKTNVSFSLKSLSIFCFILFFQLITANAQIGKSVHLIDSIKSTTVPSLPNPTTIDRTVVLCQGDTLVIDKLTYEQSFTSAGVNAEKYTINRYAVGAVTGLDPEIVIPRRIRPPNITHAQNIGITYEVPNVKTSFYVIVKLDIDAVVDTKNPGYYVLKVEVANSPLAPALVNVEPTPAVTPGGKATLSVVNPDPNLDYVWYTRDAFNNLTKLGTGNTFKTPNLNADIPFFVTAVQRGGNACGSAFTTVPVFVRNQFFIPNAFSPNNDGLNDVFKIEGKTITSGTLSIYDSWGNLIFKTNDITKGWDGYREGKLQPAGTYVYLTTGTYVDGKSFTLKGSVTLVR